MAHGSKRRRTPDANELAKTIVDRATGETKDEPVAVQSDKNPAAVAVGRAQGWKSAGEGVDEEAACRDRQDSGVGALEEGEIDLLGRVVGGVLCRLPLLHVVRVVHRDHDRLLLRVLEVPMLGVEGEL